MKNIVNIITIIILLPICWNKCYSGDLTLLKSRLRFKDELLMKDIFSQDCIAFAVQDGFFRSSAQPELRNIVVKNGWIELVGINGSLTLYPDNMCIVKLERKNDIPFITKKLKIGIRELSYLDIIIDMGPSVVGTISPILDITCLSDEELRVWRESLKREQIDLDSTIKFEINKVKENTIVKIKLVKSSDFIGYGELWERENFFK